MLLNPRSVFEWRRRKLGIIDDSQLIEYFTCEDEECCKSQASNISLYSDIATCDCGKPLNRGLKTTRINPEPEDDGVFIAKSALLFIICDDLRVIPVVSGFLQTLNNLGITDIDDAEISTLTFEYDDIMDLLKLSLVSMTPLTDLILKKRPKSFTGATDILENHGIVKEGGATKKMILKVYLQKSTNRFLLAEATDEIVEFLYSFLVIPLGGVEHLSRGNTCFKNLDNLFRSLTDVIDDKYFVNSDFKNSLINPKLSHGYISQNHFLPLSEKTPNLLKLSGTLISSFKPSKEKINFMKEETLYIVSDDLTVIPFSVTYSISIPKAMGISLSDVKEIDLQIGMEEALCILKTSLWSKTALTDALINPMLPKQPKRPNQEK